MASDRAALYVYVTVLILGFQLKNGIPYFRTTYALSADLRMKPSEKAFFFVKIKTNSNFAVKLAERSISFLSI